jgi:hypothetical protein
MSSSVTLAKGSAEGCQQLQDRTLATNPTVGGFLLVGPLESQLACMTRIGADHSCWLILWPCRGDLAAPGRILAARAGAGAGAA